MGLSRLRGDFPLGEAPRVIVTDNEGRYVGIILVSDIHRELPEETTAKDPVEFADTALLPSTNVLEAMKAFSAAAADALSVINNSAERNVWIFAQSAHSDSISRVFLRASLQVSTLG